MILYHAEFPGFHREHLTRALELGFRAVVIEGYHSGTAHACTKDGPNCPYSVLPFLEDARRRKVPVFLIFGYFLGDEDNKHGYQPFDESRAGNYVSSNLMVKAGIVPLKANWQQSGEVRRKLEEVLSRTEDYDTIINEMYEAFQFQSTLDAIRASVR